MEKQYMVRYLAWNKATREWDLPMEYVARNEQEAEDFAKFQRDWAKGIQVIELP